MYSVKVHKYNVQVTADCTTDPLGTVWTVLTAAE